MLGCCCGTGGGGGGCTPSHRAVGLKLRRRVQDAPPAPRQPLALLPQGARWAAIIPPPSRELGRPASRKGSGASASGLKKLLCSLSQSTKQRLGRFRCYSMEQLPAPGATPTEGPGMKKSPSLQSLRLVSLRHHPALGVSGVVQQEEGCWAGVKRS